MKLRYCMECGAPLAPRDATEYVCANGHEYWNEPHGSVCVAVLRDAPVLLLDEATSALDSESEAHIQDALWSMMQGRTAIAVAHRLSTVAGMDRLIVLDRGRVVEEGSHAELLARDGGYAQLWRRQSGGFLGG